MAAGADSTTNKAVAEQAEELDWQKEVGCLEAEAEQAMYRANAAETADEPDAAAGQRAEAGRLLALADAARRWADGGSSMVTMVVEESSTKASSTTKPGTNVAHTTSSTLCSKPALPAHRTAHSCMPEQLCVGTAGHPHTVAAGYVGSKKDASPRRTAGPKPSLTCSTAGGLKAFSLPGTNAATDSTTRISSPARMDADGGLEMTFEEYMAQFATSAKKKS